MRPFVPRAGRVCGQVAGDVRRCRQLCPICLVCHHLWETVPDGGGGTWTEGSTAGRPMSRGKRQSGKSAPVAAARARRAVRLVSPSVDVQAGAASARARSGIRGERASNRMEGSRTATQSKARDEGEDRACDPEGTGAETSQADDETGVENVSREDPVKDFSWHLAGVPELGSIVETKWWITFRKEIPSSQHGASESENDDSGNDGNFMPNAKKSKARKRPLNRKKKATRHEEEKWWPGIVTKLQVESDLSVSGLIKYTLQEDGHGIVLGAGPSQFTGRTCRVVFEARKPGDEPCTREVHHRADGKNSETILTPWRYFGAPADGCNPSTSHGLPGLHSVGLHAGEAPALVTPASARALQHSMSVAAGVSSPPALRMLRKFGMQRLVTSLQSLSQPPPHIKAVFKQDLGANAAMDAVQGRVLHIGGVCEATQSEFAELATWLCRETTGGRRGRVSMTPREAHFRHPSPGENFRVMFQDYGDFCEAIHVPVRQRSVFLWDKNLAKVGSPGLCVVGSVQVWDTAASQDHAFVGPLQEGTVRMSAAVRVILLGHSWNKIVSCKPVDGSEDVAVPVLRQRDITFDMEGGDSRHSFTAEIGASAARMAEEARGQFRLQGENVEGSFDIRWYPIPPVEGVPWSAKDAPGTVKFCIPVVCIRSASLVLSARMLLDDLEKLSEDESTSEKHARLQRAQDLRYAVVSPPPG